MADGFDPPVNLAGIYSISALQPSELYAVNSDLALEIPGAARLMTLFIALEKLPSDELIQISELAAKYDRDERRDDRNPLRAGDSMPLRYLLLRMMYYNSDAAAIAVAEKVSGSRASFLQEMRRTASVLGMNRTEFFALDIARVERETETPESIRIAAEAYESAKDKMDPIPFSPAEAGDDTATVKTTLRDLMRLLTALLGNSRGRALLGVSDELVQITSGGVAKIVPVRSPASHLMTLSENRISIAYLALSNRYSLICCSGVSPANVPVTTVAVHLRPTGIMQPILQFYTALDDFYERTALTRSGGKYPGGSEKAVNGELFDLLYLDSIDYIHPKADHFLEQTLDYVGNAPYPLPVQKGAMTGQVIFTLKDGVQIPVRVGSDRDILADSNLAGRGLLLMQRNPNLAYTILGLTLIICLGLVVVIIRESVKLRHWHRIRRMEQRTEEARAILLGKDRR